MAGELDHRPQGVGGLRVQRDHAFGIAFADRDPQPGVPVGVGVEAVDGQPADLVAAGAAPPGDDERGPLVRVGQLVDRGHQRGQFVVGDEPGNRAGDLRDVCAGEQDPRRDVIPAPSGGLGHEPGDQGDDGPLERHAQRCAGVLACLGAEPAQELFGVFAVQVGQAGHLGVRRGHPGHQTTKGVAEVPHGLRPVEVGLQVQPQVAVQHGADPRRREVRHQVVDPAAGVDPSGRRLVHLPDVKQQCLQRMQFRD